MLNRLIARIPRPTILEDGAPRPPVRPGVRYVRVPLLGTVVADDKLRRAVNLYFHWPMITLALFVLPLLAIDFLFLHGRVERIFTPIWWACAVATAVIWAAFTAEFVIKIAIAECRVEYVRRNWLDLIIILLPILRPLRVAYLARTSRVFTLRGVGMKFVRYIFTIVIGLEATDRYMRRFGFDAKRRVKSPEEMTRHQLVDELKAKRKRVAAWAAWYRDHHAYWAEQGIEIPPPPPQPTTDPAPAPQSAPSDDVDSTPQPAPDSCAV